MVNKLRIAFFGSPEPSRIVLDSLISSQHEIVAVITREDKKRTRGNSLIGTPVKQFADKHGIVVYTPKRKQELIDIVSLIDADVGIVVAYGQILPEVVLKAFSLGCINVHYSLLPRWRGAAPVERAILEGDKYTGISIMDMDDGLDTGDIYTCVRVEINDKDSSKELYEKLGQVACRELLNVINNIDSIKPVKQLGESTYAHKLESKDFYFDCNTSAVLIDRKIRAGALIKGAWTTLNSQAIRVYQAEIKPQISDRPAGEIDRNGLLSCLDGSILLQRIQLPSKPVMNFDAWANGVNPTLFPLKISS